MDEIEELAMAREKFEEEKEPINAQRLEVEEKARQNAQEEEALLDELRMLENQIAEISSRLQGTTAELTTEGKQQNAEVASKRMAALTMLSCERDWLQEEVHILKGQSTSLEEKVVQLSKELEEAKASAARGAEETAQLRCELHERREERASFTAQQAANAKADAGLKLQVFALDDHVSRLTQAVEMEQNMQQEEQRRLMKDREQRHKAWTDNGHSQEAKLALPARLQADHEEAHRWKDLAATLRRSMQECVAKLDGFRGHEERLVYDLKQWLLVQKQVEAEWEAAKLSRSKVEEELAREEKEVEQLGKEVDQAEAQHLEALETKLLPLRESCSQLVDRELQLVVQEQLDRHCASSLQQAKALPRRQSSPMRPIGVLDSRHLPAGQEAAPKPLPIVVGTMRR